LIERVFMFGSHGGLVGVLTEPADQLRRSSNPAILFSNIGLNHRVGPNRLYVELARKLAAEGFVSLRFDLSGFGDSEPRREGPPDRERATLDTREAMSFLERYGASQFVLVGLCSGVDSAHSTALVDDRVAGAIFIEGYAYRNWGFWLRHSTTRNLQPARWSRFLRVRADRMRGRPPLADLNELPDVFERTYPPRGQFAADLERLDRRGVRMLFVYTINADGRYNYRNQFHDTFGFRDRIDVEFYDRADHVFSTASHRELLFARLVSWLKEGFPAEIRTTESSCEEGHLRKVRSMAPWAILAIGRFVSLVTEASVC